eukprot:gene3028-3309_t
MTKIKQKAAKAAAAAVSEAPYVKQQVVQLSAASEAKIRRLLQAALSALPRSAADLDGCLDWLCYNIPAQQLPWRFTSSSSRAAAGSIGVKFLEDVYAATGYVLAPDSRAALRPGSLAAAAAAAKRKASARGNAGKAALLAAGWGDEEALSTGVLNPSYEYDLYAQYPERVRKNLARLNEEVLDLDLLEELISWVDEETPLLGAILVFLPGIGEISGLLDRLGSSSRYNRGKHWLLPLHSSISPDQQRAAFKVPPQGE